jgi:hypothetical protein
MLVPDRSCPHLFIVALGHGPDNEVHPITGLGHLAKNIRIFLDISASPHDDRNINGCGNFFGGLSSFIRRTVQAIGIGAHQLQGDHFRTITLDTLLSPGHRVIGHILEWLQSCLWPFFRRHIIDLHCNPRSMRHLAFE